MLQILIFDTSYPPLVIILAHHQHMSTPAYKRRSTETESIPTRFEFTPFLYAELTAKKY